MATPGHRLDALVAELRLSHEPLTAAQLGSLLHVSGRSIRGWVRDLNARAGRDIVVADQRGYRLDDRAYRAFRAREAEGRRTSAGRASRSDAIVSKLLLDRGRVDVFDLADSMGYSEATIEADLVRARRVVRAYGIAIVRDGDALRLEGTEPDKRRLFRSLLNTNLEQDADACVLGVSTLLLADIVGDALRRLDLDLNEYLLGDLAAHLAVATARVRGGHVLADAAAPDLAPGTLAARATTAIVEELEVRTGIRLPPGEVAALAVVLAARVGALAGDGTDPDIEALVRDAMESVAGHYLLELGHDSALRALTLHVQDLVLRSRRGQQLSDPGGLGFKHAHALIHEVSLFFAQRVEQFTGVAVEPMEVDLLSFHLGSHFQRLLQDGVPVRVALALPRYAPTDEQERRVRRALKGTATLVGAVDGIRDWTALDCDLLATAVDVPVEVPYAEVRISPLVTQADLDAILGSVRSVRHAAQRRHLRTTLLDLIDPALFRRVSGLDRADVIHVMAADLAACGLVDDTFEVDVLDRERRSSTNFGGRFAIPHSLFMDAHATGVAVLTSDTDIAWPDSPVRLVLMFAVAKESRAIFRDALDELNRVFQDPGNVARLVAAGGDFEGFSRELAAVLNS